MAPFCWAGIDAELSGGVRQTRCQGNGPDFPQLAAGACWDCRHLDQLGRSGQRGALPPPPARRLGVLTGWQPVVQACDVVLMNAFPYWQGATIDQGLATLKTGSLPSLSLSLRHG